jgi:hypothetical protein
MLYDFTGGLWHEILGIGVFILFVIHNLYNLQWIKSIIPILAKTNSETKIKFVLDVILWISMILCMISGIMISSYLFNIGVDITIWSQIHAYSSYVMFGTIIVHVLLHLKMISSFLETKYHYNESLTSMIIILILITSSVIWFYNLIKENTTLKSTDSNDNNSSDSDSSSNNGSSSNSGQGTTTPPVTLEEFLSQRHCGQCHNNCILSAIRCGRGTSKVEEATSEYYATYGETTSSTDSNDSSTYDYNGTNYTINY